MCHHYLAADNLPEHFVAEFPLRTNQRKAIDDLVAGMKGAAAWPLRPVPGLRIDDAGELVAFSAEWGLLPRWWKPSDKTPKRSTYQRKTFNARSETAAEKPTFRDAWKRRRCLLPMAEFDEKGHYFGMGEPIAFAGLWETWQGDDAEVVTATLLTCEPNAEVRGVGHHRMPVLLTTPDDRRRWLVEGAEGPDDPLLRPLADGVLSVSPADT